MDFNAANTTVCVVQPVLGISYTVVFLFGLILNVAALRLFMAKQASWTDTYVYMLNMNAADFALILFLPFRIYDAFLCLDKTYLCSFLISTHYMNIYASILTATAISVRRYLAVRFPLQARSWRKKKKVALGLCVVIWVMVVGSNVAFIKNAFPNQLCTCFERRSNPKMSLVSILCMEIIGYVFPLLIVLFCSIQTIYILLKDTDVSTSAKKKNTVSLLAANMAGFIFCYTPVHVGWLINFFLEPSSECRDNRGHEFWMFEFWLFVEWIATTNCCLDSISYYFLLKHFYSNKRNGLGLVISDIATGNTNGPI